MKRKGWTTEEKRRLGKKIDNELQVRVGKRRQAREYEGTVLEKENWVKDGKRRLGEDGNKRVNTNIEMWIC